MEKVFTREWLGRPLTIKTGKVAHQADAAVWVQYGETVVQATVVQSPTERPGVDFFPLMVELDEKLYAAGIIKGSRWLKREGRPTDQAVLSGRMIDRSIRPLFNTDDHRDVQIIITTLAVDQENDHDIVALVAASAVLSISGIDWAGPIGGIRVGLIEDKFVFNPSYKEQAKSSLDLIVAGTAQKSIMIEAAGNEIPEDLMLKAIVAGQENLQGAIDLIEELKKNVAPKKSPLTPTAKTAEEEKAVEAKLELLKVGKVWLQDNVKKILFDKVYYTKGERKLAVIAIKEQLAAYLVSQNLNSDDRQYIIKKLVEETIDQEVTEAIINEKRRVDGRALDEIRQLSAEVSLLPRVHGTSLFSRGETQVLSILTLGAPGLEQSLEGLEGQSKKRYMHHYNFPPYSVGEASPLRGTGRREIGHGALAEKALMPMIPSKEEFPYTIRLVSETLGSNGSSSMASTCASSLALMDAGVPIKKAVAGIAMGLASNQDMSKWVVLTDIQDLEDGQGGMDFKITGTDTGLTAIQLDTKTTGITVDIIKQTLEQGRAALNQILDVMKQAIPAPRAELSKYAPRLISFMVDPEKIGTIIGPGGKIINKIIDETGVSIDIEDNGLVMICGTDAAMVDEAVRQVKEIVHEFAPNEILKGKVVRMLDFGAFISLNANQDGMAHVSELAPYRIEKPSDFLSIGDEVTVKIKEVDDQGRINLTLKGLAENEALWKDEKGKSNGNSFGSSRGNGGPSRPSRFGSR
ncbi:polyribonucleotide nucleotidyltransferase [Candidatus Falkowbacteria bacterium]|uniref:Polyribonucleotide nucleotidyltransferase n=1 Tax=Candidatus Falkowbacteria bacterium CG10_big_fil_rev_8_21_14_0_10_37_18 TaxID=1974562 RepID=A0A2H0V8G6_9BACT|nr:polyribonucleotide nucleotidyltransferase [Candidatus Falkowbacteria bacterium]NCQ12993.1 polyribonucleotide nucleotidyltransferase [Candidatus Falkowbacteria bacterium]PIR95361.1 MAG: polyribonucleotide nucleotidyltransferase [Candidatus Falkowbacteria bacterium CG10_big_fil_rev_8_21_14_0_10_37_18]